MQFSHWKKLVSLFGVLALASACELEAPEEEPNDSLPFEEIRDGVFKADASSDKEWLFVDLDTLSAVGETDGWDLAFQRTLIAGNSEAGVMIARIDGVKLADVEAAPEEGYHLDGERKASDGRGGGGDEFAFNGESAWYDYDMSSHLLTPKANRVYVVLSSEGKAFAIQMLGYYDNAGTAGVITFEMKEIEPPEDPTVPVEPKYPEDAITIDATDEETWIYFDLDTNEAVDAEEEWELAFRRSHIATNGFGGVRVAILDGVSLDDVSEAPEDGYVADDFEITEENLDDLAFHGDTPWFRYDMETHTLQARERVYVLATEEKVFAVQILDYYDEEGNAGHVTFRAKEITGEEEPLVGTEVTIDASDRDVWVYFNLDTGEVTDAESPWHMAFKSHVIATNGPGHVGVAVVDGVNINQVTRPPAQEYHVDDPEGDTADLAFHGEDAWYTYNPSNHDFAAKKRVYVVAHTEDNTAYAVQMIGFTNEEGDPGYPTFIYKELEQ